MDSEVKKLQKFNPESSAPAEKKRRYLESGHTWKTDDDGFIETFAFFGGMHNGPECETCGYFTCWHCSESPSKCEGPQQSNQIN